MLCRTARHSKLFGHKIAGTMPVNRTEHHFVLHHTSLERRWVPSKKENLWTSSPSRYGTWCINPHVLTSNSAGATGASPTHQKLGPTQSMEGCPLRPRHEREIYTGAREGQPPAKDPPNSHTYIHPSIQAYTETKAEAILTSIYIKQSRSKTHKTKQTHYNNAPPKQHPKQHPKKQNSKKSITLYNSKYCIRVVLRRKKYDIFCSIVPLHLSCLPVRRFQEKHSSAPLL